MGFFLIVDVRDCTESSSQEVKSTESHLSFVWDFSGFFSLQYERQRWSSTMFPASKLSSHWMIFLFPLKTSLNYTFLSRRSQTAGTISTRKSTEIQVKQTLVEVICPLLFNIFINVISSANLTSLSHILALIFLGFRSASVLPRLLIIIILLED